MYTNSSKNAIRVNRDFDSTSSATNVNGSPIGIRSAVSAGEQISFKFERFRSNFGHNDRADCAAEDKKDGITAKIPVPRVGMRMPRPDYGKAFR